MNADQAVAFLHALRVKQIRVKGNGWVEGTCPLAHWLHRHQTDNSPSFGLRITPGSRSYFMCFACRQGSAEELLATLELYTKGSTDYDFATCHQILAEEQYVVPLPEYQEFPSQAHVFEQWPEWWLDSFQGADWVSSALDYLTFRNISLTKIKEFDLRYDEKRHMIVAPYRDAFHRLAGARGRTISDMGKKRHYDYTFHGINNARLVWYHEQALNLPGPVVTCEGQFDAIRVSMVFPKVVAALSAKPTAEKMKKLGDSGTVVQIPDRDEAGQQSVPAYAKFCQQLGLKHKVVLLDAGVKDPADCSPDYLKDKITAALSTP